MKNKIKYLYTLLLFSLFIPKVYAFTYDINMSVDSTSVKEGNTTEIKVSLDNIQGDNDGIVTCSMNISFDSNILLVSKIRTLNSWSMTVGNFYVFDTGDAVFDKTDMFVIPVKVNGNGSVRLFNIVCSDAVVEEKTNDKEIKFTVLSSDKETNNSQNNNSNQNDAMEDNNTLVEDSNADLSNIILSEGEIEFDPDVTEYIIEVSEFDKLEITPVKVSDKAQYILDRNIVQDDGSNTVVITVTAENGDTKVYTIYVDEKKSDDNNSENKNNIYIPIFIGIICVLVIINIVRIVKSKKK